MQRNACNRKPQFICQRGGAPRHLRISSHQRSQYWTGQASAGLPGPCSFQGKLLCPQTCCSGSCASLWLHGFFMVSSLRQGCKEGDVTGMACGCQATQPKLPSSTNGLISQLLPVWVASRAQRSPSVRHACTQVPLLGGSRIQWLTDRGAVVMGTPPLCPSLEDPSTELSTGSAETSMTVLPFNTVFNSYFVPSLPQVFPRTPSSDRPAYQSPPLSWLPSAQSSPSMG